MVSGEVLLRILLLLAIILLTGWFLALWRTVRVRGLQPARGAVGGKLTSFRRSLQLIG